MSTRDDTATLRALSEAAMSGTWRVPRGEFRIVNERDEIATHDGTAVLADLEFAAAAVNHVRALLALHYEVHESTADEVWGRPGVCSEDGFSWPCSTATPLASPAPAATETGVQP